MEYITARAGERMLYIEKERIEEILMSPEIWRVPGAPENILGISLYNHKLVVYYSHGTVCPVSCGILIRNDAGELYGMAADCAGEESISEEEAETAMVPVNDGLWEKKSD